MKRRSPVVPATAWCYAALLTLVTGCASVNPDNASAPSSTDKAPKAVASNQAVAWTSGQNWQTYHLPGKKPTLFSPVSMDGRSAVLAVADSSASLLRQQVHVASSELQNVRFSWKVPQLIEAADMALRDGDDSPVRVVLTFEGNRANWSAKNAMLSELSQVLTGEELPYATLMYVWCNKRAPGSVIHNPRTDRIRKMVVESGSKNLNQWMDYERNIRADFERAFGEAPGALLGVALMTDSDNTRSKTRAYYGPISMRSFTAALPVTGPNIP
jgi:Protein of unknown function (DUF3047)